jgi:hypothetical protein
LFHFMMAIKLNIIMDIMQKIVVQQVSSLMRLLLDGFRGVLSFSFLIDQVNLDKYICL